MTDDTQKLRPAAVPRRDLLRMAAVGATAAVMAPRFVSAGSAGAVKIEEPFDGAILHHRHGKPSAKGLTVSRFSSTNASWAGRSEPGMISSSLLRKGTDDVSSL